jgi:putative ABC transport system ATP-binding protein
LISGVKPKIARKRALEVIAEVGLSDWANRRPDEMSGGQRQRMTIARALAAEPAIIWADEPTGSLDSETSAEVVDLMLQLNQKNKQTFLWVTHALEVATLAQRLIRMRDGCVVDDTETA